MMKHRNKMIGLFLIALLTLATFEEAGTVYVATSKNLRGALYLGVGPTPGHASEMALVKCSQDS